MLARLVGVLIIHDRIVGVEIGLRRHRACRHLAKAVPDHVLHEIPVHRIHHRLAEILVGGGTFTVVHPCHGMRREIFPTLSGGTHTIHLGQALHIPVLDRATGKHIDLTILKRHGPRGRIGDHPVIDFVQIGLPIQIVVLVLHKVDIAALFPLVELVGAGPDGRVVRRVVGEIGAFIDVLGDHRHGAGLKDANEGAKGVLELENNRMVIRRGDRFHMLQAHPKARMGFTQEGIDRKHHILGGERLAIVPRNPFVQFEGIGQRIIRNLPRFGQRGHRVQVIVVAQKAFVNVARHKLRRAVLNQAQHQAGWLGLHHDIKAAPGVLRKSR